METLLRNTTCSKGHTHPPWNTTGILRIAKCESICGFCQKETKTAANLRKHVAIHIKNERLNLTIAEGSSGRGRLEMPQTFDRESSSSSRISDVSHEMDIETIPRRDSAVNRHQRPIPHHANTDPFSPSAVLMSMNQHPGSSRSSYSASYSQPTTPIPLNAYSYSTTTTYTTPAMAGPSSYIPVTNPPNYSDRILSTIYPEANKDLFRTLREHKIRTKTAWTVIPASEGNRILDLCKSLSVAQSASSPVLESRGGGGGPPRIPCYHRETLFDEEWQAHMRDVHGIFLIWPETWMRRIEVLDLEPYGGDIGGINDLIMDS